MTGDRFVRTRLIQAAVRGRETDVLAALGIQWNGHTHIHCPFPDHDDANPSWRWDLRRARGFCTCAAGKALSIFDVIGRMQGGDFDAAKIRAAEMLGRADLINQKGASGGTKMTAAALLAPPADRSVPELPRMYLADRLNVDPDQVPMPATPGAGWLDLEYWDPPAEKRAKPRLIGKHPCAVFGTIAPDGRTHAHRIYTRAGGHGKADLEGRDPKKSATLVKGATARGCAVIWGDRDRAPWLLLAEGIETAAAIALVFKAEIGAGQVYVAAAISEAGVGNFAPWPATKRATVCADRDEAKRKSEAGYRAGEKAARRFAKRHRGKLEVGVALPGEPGGKVDFLDLLLRDGAGAVRAVIEAGEVAPATAEDQADQTTVADDGREPIRLSALNFNANICDCARGLRDLIYMRGPIPRVLARAEIAGGRHVEDRDGEAVEISGLRYRPGSLLFIDATPEITSWHLDQRFTFWKLDQRSNEWVPTPCPSKVAARVVGAATELGFRPCSGFVRVPLFIDGKIVATPGWHAPTGLIIDVRDDPPAIPERPTKDEASTALARLLRPFRVYLKDNPSLRPALAAAALTAALRPSLPTAPAILVDGNVIGAGKGKVARALAILATGGLPAIIAEGHNHEETEKRITTAVLQGASALMFDNLQRTVASSTLESILTEGVATVRIFGKLADVTVECRALILMTANNATLRRDMLRRTLPVRIVVPDEKPELRRFDFDPVDEARRDRTELLAAAFTIAKAWYAARDLPENVNIRAKTLGSFEAWADLVAGAVHWLTDTNPIDAVETKKSEHPGALAERAVITSLFNTFDGEFTAAEAGNRIEPTTWREVLNFKAECPDGRAVGNWLLQRRDRAFSITPDDQAVPIVVTLEVAKHDRKGIARWKLEIRSPKASCNKSTGFHAVPPYRAVPVQPYAEKVSEKVIGDDDGGDKEETGDKDDSFWSQGPTDTARYGGTAASDDRLVTQPASERNRVGSCVP